MAGKRDGFSSGMLRHPTVSARFSPPLCPPWPRAGDESTPPLSWFSCTRFKGFLKPCLKKVFNEFLHRFQLFHISRCAAPHAAGEGANRAAALMHGPHAPRAQLRRLLQLRAGELPCQFAPRVFPLHCASPSTGMTPNRTRRATPPSSAVTYARRCRRSIRTGQPANAARGPSRTCHVPSA